jgi:hypothetical protein
LYRNQQLICEKKLASLRNQGGDQEYTAAEASKLSGIEANADVTDAANVEPLVDTHLNTGTATTGEVLSWTGSDYDWITAVSVVNVQEFTASGTWTKPTTGDSRGIGGVGRRRSRGQR